MLAVGRAGKSGCGIHRQSTCFPINSDKDLYFLGHVFVTSMYTHNLSIAKENLPLPLFLYSFCIPQCCSAWSQAGPTAARCGTASGTSSSNGSATLTQGKTRQAQAPIHRWLGVRLFGGKRKTRPIDTPVFKRVEVFQRDDAIRIGMGFCDVSGF